MTTAEIRELIRKLRADASVWGTEQAPLYAEAATVLDELLARVEGMESAIDELNSAFSKAFKARAALSGGTNG